MNLYRSFRLLYNFIESKSRAWNSVLNLILYYIIYIDPCLVLQNYFIWLYKKF